MIIGNKVRLLSLGFGLVRTLASTARSSALLSDPFNDQLKVIRDSAGKFPKPNFISFDVFGTLYTPKETIAQQYHGIALKEFGIEKSITSIDSEFPKIYSRLSERYPNYGKGCTEIRSCEEWWLELIVELFDIPHFRENEKSAQLCNRLMNYFTGTEAYRLYDDVIPTLTALKEKNVKMVVSSNSDLRVLQILKSMGLTKFFEPDHVYLSYDLDASKPDRAFFDKIANNFIEEEELLMASHSVEKLAYLERCWHIGDSYDKDFLGPVRSGWNGILLDRENTSKFFNNAKQPSQSAYPVCFSEKPSEGVQGDELKIIANNRVVLRNLSQLLNIFELDPVLDPSSKTNN